MVKMESACEESVEERQENELQFLQSMYNEDVEDLRNHEAWKVWRPLDLSIMLRPQESMGAMQAHVSVKLHVKCSAQYPHQIPDIRLENAVGLPKQLMLVLLGEVKELAKSLKGEVMILDLCQHIQGFLHTHNRPPPSSFYEQMLQNKQRQDEVVQQEIDKHQEMLRQKEERQVAEIEAEIQKQREALKEDAKLRREKMGLEHKLSTSEPSTPNTDGLQKMTPIPMDSQQRLRSRSSSSPRRILDVDVLSSAEIDGSYTRPTRRSPTRSLSEDLRTSTPVNRKSVSEDDNEECTDHMGTCILVFDSKKERSVYRGKCLGHSVRGSTVYSAMDIQTGDLVAISEWNVKWRSFKRKLNLHEKEEDEKEGAKYLKQVASLEQEFHSLMRLHHPNIVHYQAFKYQQDHGAVTIYMMMDYVGGSNLNQPLLKEEAVPIDQITHYCHQLLEGLGYLHNKAVVHKDLRASSVMLDNRGKVRLTDYSVVKRLADLVCEAQAGRPGVKFETKQPVTLGRGGKKADVYRLGVLLLSLAEGRVISEHLPEVPKTLPPDFHDFLSKCLMPDEHQRWSVCQLVEHAFVKTPVSTQPNGRKRSEDQSSDEEEQQEQDEQEDIPLFHIIKADGQSRLNTEFEALKWLGKGAFGDVIKVRNKLDGRYYAIKRIPLIPNRKQITRKITREVKMLSRLNHENVVRYYNSWIETSNEPVPSDSSNTSLTFERSSKPPSPPSPPSFAATLGNPLVNSIGIVDQTEALVPSALPENSSWGTSFGVSGSEQVSASSSSSSSEDDDSDDEFAASFLKFGDSDDGIDFEDDDGDDEVDGQSPVKSPTALDASKQSPEENSSSQSTEPPKLQFLYIQMEFCEKSTLRNVIDAGVYQDVDRVWQLFREITEGLVHIHEQGMIHRDLKPVNIFLDSNDHVKIGDFGLATTDILAKQHTTFVDNSMNPSASMEIKHNSSSKSESVDEGGLTGQVGTALYVSPEMTNSQTRTNYNQKVDIYSLGIMFFEMCYRPLDTGMERVKILTNLRLPSIEFPVDFDEITMQNQVAIIRWLLKHNPAKRPTSKELLRSDLLPAPKMEEAALNEVLRSAISDPDSRSYHHMLNTIFSQPVLPAKDFAYDNDFYKVPVGGWTQQHLLAQRLVSDCLEKVFRKHGAVKLTTPLLMPRDSNYEANDSYVRLMDHSGGVVALSYDLRAPFARYVARNSIRQLKRYTIDRVFRESRLRGSRERHWVHPRELTACAFDIVSPNTASFVPDAEVLQVIWEITQEFPGLQARHFYLRINHSSLLKAVLIHCGISEELHSEVYAILSDTKSDGLHRLQTQTRLCSLSLTDSVVEALYSYVQVEKPFNDAASLLRKITKSTSVAGSLAKKALHEMEAILKHAKVMGCKLEPVLAVGLVYGVQQFSGAIFQVVADVRRKKRTTMEVLAAGGRYDTLLTHYRKPGTPPVFQCVVGISVSFDKILSSVTESQGNSHLPNPYDILVCSLGHKAMLKEKMSIIKDLWSAGLHAELHLDSSEDLEEIQTLCRANGISHLVILKDLESTVKVKSFDKVSEKVTEKRLAPNELADYLLSRIANRGDLSESQPTGPAKSVPVCHSMMSSGEGSYCLGCLNQGGSGSLSSGSGPLFNITLIPMDKDKLAKNVKRAYEAQIYSCVNKILSSFNPKSLVDILGLEVNADVLKTMAAHIEISGEETNFDSAASAIVERLPRYKKYLSKVFDTIQDTCEQRKRNSQKSSGPVIILFGLKDDSYRVLL